MSGVPARCIWARFATTAAPEHVKWCGRHCDNTTCRGWTYQR